MYLPIHPAAPACPPALVPHGVQLLLPGPLCCGCRLICSPPRWGECCRLIAGFLFISWCKHSSLAAACFSEPRKTIFPYIYNLVKCQATEVLTVISSRGNLFICCKGGFHSRDATFDFFFYASLTRNVGCSCDLPSSAQTTFPMKLTTAVPAWLSGFPAPLPRRTYGPSQLGKEKQGKCSEVGVSMCLVRRNEGKSHKFPIFHFSQLLCISCICFPDQHR